jgi:hypothetical protein
MKIAELLTENVNYNTARQIAMELHQDLEDLNAIIASGSTISAGHEHNRNSLKQSIVQLYTDLQDLGYQYDPLSKDYIKPLTIDIEE